MSCKCYEFKQKFNVPNSAIMKEFYSNGYNHFNVTTRGELEDNC